MLLPCFMTHIQLFCQVLS